MKLSEITNYLQDICHNGKADKEVIFENAFYDKIEIAEVEIIEHGGKLLLKLKSNIQKEFEEVQYTNYCRDCESRSECPHGSRCEKCDNGNLFTPAKKSVDKIK